MGRWAQRQRGGGGINSPVQLLSASLGGGVLATATFTGPVNAAAFTALSFTSTPSGATGSFITQSTAASVNITFSADVSGDDDLVYNGSVANTVFPATVPYT